MCCSLAQAYMSARKDITAVRKGSGYNVDCVGGKAKVRDGRACPSMAILRGRAPPPAPGSAVPAAARYDGAAQRSRCESGGSIACTAAPPLLMPPPPPKRQESELP